MSLSSRRTSPDQFEIILDFCDLYPQIISGKVDDVFTKEVKDKIWQTLVDALNSEGNATKSLQDWRKTFKDWKFYVKKKAMQIALKNQTAGGPKEKLTENEERLIRAINEVNTGYEQNSGVESPNYEDSDLDVSSDIEVIQNSTATSGQSTQVDIVVIDLQDDLLDYQGNDEAEKEEDPLAAKINEKFISLNGNNETLRKIAECRLALMEQHDDDEAEKEEDPLAAEINETFISSLNGNTETLRRTAKCRLALMEQHDDEAEKEEDPLAAEINEKFISSLNGNNETLRRIAECRLALMERHVALLDQKALDAEIKAEMENQNKRKEIKKRKSWKKFFLMEKQVKLLKRRTLAAESKAAAKEKLVLLQRKKLHYEWRNKIHEIRMKKLEYL